MGQYYYSAILDAETGELLASLSPHPYRNGAKLTEHAYYGNAFVGAVIAKAASYGRPVRLAWVGDYAEESDVWDGCNRRFFPAAESVWRDERLRVLPQGDPETAAPPPIASTGIALNHAKMQYIRLGEYEKTVVAIRKRGPLPNGHPMTHRIGLYDLPEWMEEYGCGPEEFVLHPIPILTAIGNGKGGGDYKGYDMGWVGVWALDPISFLPEGSELPEGEWADITSSFAFEEKAR